MSNRGHPEREYRIKEQNKKETVSRLALLVREAGRAAAQAAHRSPCRKRQGSFIPLRGLIPTESLRWILLGTLSEVGSSHYHRPKINSLSEISIGVHN